MKPDQRLAEERIQQLFQEAATNYQEYPTRAHRYVHLARKIAMKARISIPKIYNKTYCRNCSHYWQPGSNVRIRNHKGRIIYYCLDCKHYKRMIIKKTKKTA
ncbi:MAG TPA: ribonuclease P [Candidatus Nanoarchaeia archaeon]|nr:ribonuclease P [Candidatus Nanoarchaeia archaeon]